MGFRIGIDIGGTFTDLVAINEDTGEVLSVKTPSTPGNPALGVMDAIRQSGIKPEDISYLVHGSTLGLNSLVEHKEQHVGLICTKGFRDTLEIRRVWREKLFDPSWDRPETLIPRKLRRGVSERIDWQGNILTPLQEDEVMEAVRFLRAQGVHSYAVSFLFSFLNPAHERRVRELILKEHPGAFVSLSCEVLPEIREYERTSTTVLNAMLKPIMRSYIRTLRECLLEMGISAPLRILKVNGGVVNAESTLDKPVEAFASGPAGGVMGAAYFGLNMQLPNLITLDMGGTTTDVGVIQNYQPLFTMEKDIAWNIPVRGSMLDVKSIGAGGGSIAWHDRGKRLRVGPQSAGAQPGPACYRLGGQEPTITDAQLTLGRINPANFLSGSMFLDQEAAASALDKLSINGQSEEDTAYQIYQLSMSEMAQLIREMTTNRGQEPRDFKLVSFGGAGAMYAADLAEELGIPEVYIPANAGVFSAFGSLCADVILDYLQTYYVPLAKLDFKRVDRIFTQLYEQGIAQIENDYGEATSRFTYLFDLRYMGEAFEITVPITFHKHLTALALEEAVNLFHAEHKRLYGFNRPDEPLELVNLRVKVLVPQPKPSFTARAQTGKADAALIGQRPVYFRSMFEYVSTPVYAWNLLADGMVLEGPAVIEDGETTVIIPPQHKCTLDDFGNIRIIINQRLMLDTDETESTEDAITTRLYQMEKSAYIEPVGNEVFLSSLESICREMGNTMLRTAYSPIFADGMDFACGILDDQGELAAAVNYCPVHLAAMALAPEWALMEIGFSDLAPGDVILTNDPYCGGTHITDFTIIKPIFYEGKLIAMASNRAHHLDVGGKAAGGFPGDATEIFQEGIRIPPVKWFRGGVENTDIFDTLLSNVRLPWVQIGDFRAQLASVLTAEQRILQLCRNYGIPTFKHRLKRLKEHSEAWMRREIEAIPDGTYSFSDFIEDDGVTTLARKIQVKITVEQDRMTVDFTGTASQARGPLNAVYGVTASSVFNALLQMTDPSIPINCGLFRPVKIIAPRGTLVNPNYPAATFGANTDTNLRIVEVVIGALAKVLPDKVTAATYGTCNNFTGGGYDPVRESPFVFYFFNEGGWGARSDRDGLTSTFNPIGNCKDVPVEVVESNYPFLYKQAELHPDSAGAGKYRGGFGTIRTLQVLTDQIEVNAVGERHKLKPYGLFKGKPAETNAFLVTKARITGTFAEIMGAASPSKFSNVLLGTGDEFSIIMAGGGGYGSPLDRDPLLVLADVEEEVISMERAAEEYGVVLRIKNEMNINGSNHVKLEIDWEATARRREQLRLKPLEHVINDVIEVDELSYRLRTESDNEFLVQDNPLSLEDKTGDRLAQVKAQLDQDFCHNSCPYQGHAKICPMYNDQALHYWSIDSFQRWMRKKCLLKVKI
ncbi:hydantoinase B/oxoprolinase family protein [Paradesulfitobacterium ferrireducens]|uniref:hydantoinase B/oxoprolinase family protein n=1 Tax=Paradesulfitobacterium ferrireducens TaxID=2816476 RepID=UPI001A908681|nr:hydantoinase B/oxoprolinase family protein [Paradesulfitobacterium ferrireducens]